MNLSSDWRRNYLRKLPVRLLLKLSQLLPIIQIFFLSLFFTSFLYPDMMPGGQYIEKLLHKKTLAPRPSQGLSVNFEQQAGSYTYWAAKKYTGQVSHV